MQFQQSEKVLLQQLVPEFLSGMSCQEKFHAIDEPLQWETETQGHQSQTQGHERRR